MKANIEINRNKLKLVETIVWLLYDYCMTIVWLLYDYCMTIVWQWTFLNSEQNSIINKK